MPQNHRVKAEKNLHDFFPSHQPSRAKYYQTPSLTSTTDFPAESCAKHRKSQVIIESCHTLQRTSLGLAGIRQLWERILLPKEHSSLCAAPISCSGLETSSSCIFLRTPMTNSVYNAYVVHTPALREMDGAEDREVGKLHEILSYLCHNMTLGGGL